jgi:hypothetical protein
MSMQVFTLIMNKIFMLAPRIMKIVAYDFDLDMLTFTSIGRFKVIS